MVKTFLGILTVIPVLFFLWYPAAYAYSGPDDHAALKAADAAVKRLGPERGAVGVSGTIRKILGLEAVGYAGDVQEISEDLADLGAEKRGMEVRVSLSGDVLFDFDKYNVRQEAEGVLRKLVKGIRELGWGHIIIEGHTDSRGSEAYNLRLSEKRAAVREWFVTKGGLGDIQFETKGYGESRPVAPNTKPDGSDNPDGRAKNRRVEIRIKR